MPDPERLLKTIARAVELIQGQPGRRGRLVELRDADEVLVAGDMHGHVANFQTIYKIADLAGHPRRHLVLQEVVHGKFRYPLGGDKSHQLLDLFSALKNQFPTRVHLLMGNHELSQWTDRSVMKADEDLNVLFVNGIQEAYGERASRIYGAYRQLFAVLPLAIRTANRVFLSHSLPAPKYAGTFSPSLLERDEHSPEELIPKGGIYGLLWGRDCTAENAGAFLKSVDSDWLVTGHIPCEGGFAVPNGQQIILDCCTAAAAHALFPADRPIAHEEFLASIHVI